MRVAALGRTRLLYDTIRSLAAAGHDIPLVVTCRAAPEYNVREDDFRSLALDLGAEFALTQDLNNPDSLGLLARAHADVAVSVNWINVVGREACETFPYGILNAHAGDLPRYRGNAPVAWAILQGESRVGVVIHRMDPKEIDAGPILVTDHYQLGETTYVGDVYRFLERRVPEMFVEAVAGLAAGTITARPQPSDSSLALRCYPRRPEDGLVNWLLGATALGRLVRAAAEPFSGAFTYFRGERLTIWRARAEAWPCPSLAVPGHVVRRDRSTGEVSVATGDGVLVLEEIESPRAGRCRPATLITSVRERLGERP
jgi:UDP-4-amino-4-deoxy-L-arabinose formyltransferase/UDP-glucuronic acid dehydrogenase (UDP-4-keto-hexauronic acid decarboxylating)